MAKRDCATTTRSQDESVPQGHRKRSFVDDPIVFATARSRSSLWPGNRVQFAAENGYGSGGQRVLGALGPEERGGDGRAIRVCMAFSPVRMPLVLSPAERDHRDRPNERLIPVAVCIVKHKIDLMRIVMVLIDKHERPLTIGALQRICGNQQVSLRVLHVAGSWVELVFSGGRVAPLPG